VAADSAGNFVVVWASYTQDGSDAGIFGQRYADSGAPLGPEFAVNTYTTNAQRTPSIAAEPSGNFVVVWQSYGQDGFADGIVGQRYASSGSSLGSEFRINTYTSNRQSRPSVAADSSGGFVVVWASEGQDGSGYGIFGQRYASSGAPLGPEFRANTYTTKNQGLPSVAADSAGNYVVTWHSYVGDMGGGFLDYDILGQRYASSGIPLGNEFRVNTYTTDYQVDPSVATDAAGNFVIVWKSDLQDGSISGVFGQRFSMTGAPLGSEFRVNTYTTNIQNNPDVAADAAGNFVVTWTDGQFGPVTTIHAQRFATSGVPLGLEFRVNTFVTNYQQDSSVASDSVGNFVVTWESFGQDGSEYGVFGQRYSPMVPVELMQLRVE
jgi:hypothetical protein